MHQKHRAARLAVMVVVATGLGTLLVLGACSSDAGSLLPPDQGRRSVVTPADSATDHTTTTQSDSSITVCENGGAGSGTIIIAPCRR